MKSVVSKAALGRQSLSLIPISTSNVISLPNSKMRSGSPSSEGRARYSAQDFTRTRAAAFFSIFFMPFARLDPHGRSRLPSEVKWYVGLSSAAQPPVVRTKRITVA